MRTEAPKKVSFVSIRIAIVDVKNACCAQGRRSSVGIRLRNIERLEASQYQYLTAAAARTVIPQSSSWPLLSEGSRPGRLGGICCDTRKVAHGHPSALPPLAIRARRGHGGTFSLTQRLDSLRAALTWVIRSL